MAGVVHVDGPAPPEGELWCFVCAMLYKGAALAQIKEQVDYASADHGMLSTFDLPNPGEKFKLRAAVCWGIYPPWAHPGLGTNGSGVMPFPVPLCWTHTLAANAMDSMLQPGTAADAQAIARGPADLSPEGRRSRQG